MISLAATAIIATTLTWVLWHYLREIWFVVDLDRAEADLFDMALIFKRLDDPAYLQAKGAINSLTNGRAGLTLPIVVRSLVQQNGWTPRIQSEHAEFEVFLQVLCERVMMRTMRFILCESLFGFAVGVIAIILPSGAARSRVRKNGGHVVCTPIGDMQTA